MESVSKESFIKIEKTKVFEVRKILFDNCRDMKTYSRALRILLLNTFITSVKNFTRKRSRSFSAQFLSLVDF